MDVGAHAVRRPIERRAVDSMIAQKTKTKQKNKNNEKNVTPEPDNETNKKRPLDTVSRHLLLVNYGERMNQHETLALGYPFLGPSRHVRVYYGM